MNDNSKESSNKTTSSPSSTTTDVSTQQTDELEECPPPLWDQVASSYCSNSSGRHPVRMDLASAKLELPTDGLRATIDNRSNSDLEVFSNLYTFYTWRNDQWYFIHQKRHLATGDQEGPSKAQREWQIRVNTSALDTLTPPDSSINDYHRFVFRFPPGRYAFGVPIKQEKGDAPSLYASEFEVEGADVPLETSEELTNTDRDGSTLVVRTQHEQMHDDSRRVSLLIDTKDHVPDGNIEVTKFELYNPQYELFRSLSRETLRQKVVTLLRDAFASVDSSINRIRVETLDTTSPPLGFSENDSLIITYDNQPWRLTAENGWKN